MTGPKQMSEKQIEANRRNAQRSTGPRTSEGKAVSRYNALKHGILAQAVLPAFLEGGESREEFENLLGSLRADLAPASSVEEMLVEQVAVGYWRLGRALRSEVATAYDHRCHESWTGARWSGRWHSLRETKSTPPTQEAIEKEEEWLSAMEGHMGSPDLLLRLLKAMPHRAPERPWPQEPAQLVAYTRAFVDRRRHELAQAQQELDAREAQEQVHNARAAMPELDTALLYARYIASIERQIARCLDQLERLQRLRGGDAVPPPLKVNVALSNEGEAQPL